MPRFVALLRGVNVGKGKRVPMADLKALLERLGFTEVRTLLNSGNAVFTSAGRSPARHAAAIATALTEEMQVTTPVIVKSATELAAIINTSPITPPETEHARLLVAFAGETEALQALEPLTALAAAPERFVVTERAAYLHCPAGILTSRVGEALLGRAGRRVTTRNWATVLKLRALTGASTGRALLLAVAASALLSACHLPFTRSAAPPRKAVFILLDGIPADVIERVPTPAIDAIAAAGGYTRATVGGELGGPTETPTVSAPGYMSLLTGTWANKHNVRGNSNQSPNYAYWNLFRIVETVAPSRRTALFSTWLDNRTVLIGEGRPEAGNIRLDHHADGFERDTVAFPHDADSHYIRAIDERVASEAAAYIAANGPDLTWVYLQHTDDAGHAHGDSEAFHTAAQQADARVGRIWEAVKQRQATGEAWMIVVTTDHGRDARTGKGHGGQSERERTTWIVTNHPALGPRFTDGTPAIVDIAPSILEHLRIAPPAVVVQGMDGVSFLRPGTGRN